MSLEDVAKVTKIQPRILERLETGQLDGLPADVFVRGFVRSVARCIGLDEGEALRRYAACAPGSISTPATGATGSVAIAPTARALVDAMGDLVPGTATGVRATPRKMLAVSVIAGEPDGLAGSMPVLDLAAGSLGGLPAAAAADEPMRLPEASAVASGAPRTLPVAEASTDPATAGLVAVPAPPIAAPPAFAASVVTAAASLTVPAEDSAGAPPPVANASPTVAVDPAALTHVDDELESPAPAAETPAPRTAATQGAVARTPAPAPGSKKKRSRRAKARDRRKALSAGAAGAPPIVASVDEAVSTAPWAPRMPPLGTAPSLPWRKPAYAATAAVVPRLVIDDADPDSAERVLEERAETHAPRRSFLPPILLDREDRSARQGGLTLAVIILLIAATLTLSYLMRRPSASGDGVTRLEAPGDLSLPDREPSNLGLGLGLGRPARG